jgi:hypothetical protein
VAETINGLADLLAKAKTFAKNYKGGKAEAAKAKAYEENIKKAQNALLKNKDVPDSLKTALVANQATAQPAWDFYKTGQACTVSGNSGGGDAFFRLHLADCGGFSKAVEDEAEAINNAKNSFGCNCVLGHCNEVTAIFNKVIAGNSQKSDYISLGTGDFPLLSGVAENSGLAINSGIDAGKNCFQVKIEKKFNTGTASLDLKNYIKLPAENKIVLKDERGEAGVEISLLPISKGSLNDLERYLRFGGKSEEDYTGSKITIYKDKVSPEFLVKVEEICTNLRIEPNYLMACMAFETGETFSPCVKNPGSSATGLIQFMRKTAENLGTTTEKLCNMTAEEQLDYVEKYFLPYKGKIHSIADIYMVIFCPKGVGKEMSYTLYPPRQIDYERNKGLDKDKNKEITKQEAYDAVKHKLEKGLN